MREISILDTEYPKNLRSIYNPPASLYIKGNITPGDDFAVALVGSRKASIYGLGICERLAFELASRGVTVISGLARGVDSAAHRGALKANGRTIAVLGSGLNRIYPPENRDLARQIEKKGAVLSIFPRDTEPFPFNFPIRNRIISGLSLGVVVVEASLKSGALITAGFALDEGREVFAVPGKVDSPTSAGVHRLIKEGAKLVETADDVIEELNLALQEEGSASASSTAVSPSVNLEGTESRIYSLLSSDEPKYIDDITHESGLLLNEVSGVLLRLQLRKLVKELPGKLYYK